MSKERTGPLFHNWNNILPLDGSGAMRGDLDAGSLGFGVITNYLKAAGNEVVKVLDNAGSPVSSLSITNADTGDPLLLEINSTDTHAGMHLVGKGQHGYVRVTGELLADGARIKDGSLFERTHVRTVPDPNSTSTTYTRGGAALSVGSPTTPLAINSRTRPYRRNTNNITVGSGIIQTNYTSTQRRWDPHLEGRIFTGTDITHVRYWFGLFSASPNNVNDPATKHFAAFRYITAVDGTAFWRTATSDGATSTVTTTTASIAVSTEYRLRVECDLARTEVRFYVDDILVSTHTTNLPALDTMLGHGLWFQPLATAGGTRFIEWSYVDLSMN